LLEETEKQNRGKCDINNNNNSLNNKNYRRIMEKRVNQKPKLHKNNKEDIFMFLFYVSGLGRY